MTRTRRREGTTTSARDFIPPGRPGLRALREAFSLTCQRGQLVPCRFAPMALATFHPSSILRRRSTEDRRAAMARFVSDLREAAAVLARTA